VARWPSNATLEELGDFVPQPLKPALRRTRDLALGTWPPSLAEWRLARTPLNPLTFNDKVRYRIAYDRRPHLTTFADKVAVRDYVTDRVGADYLTPQYGVHRSSAEIDWASLPREYVVKASHGSGAVVLVSQQADTDARLPARTRWVGWDRFAVRPAGRQVDDPQLRVRPWPLPGVGLPRRAPAHHHRASARRTGW